ncbi:MAG: hypothetical protein PHN75_19620, partial [Syntrophales bacterium]|nr:hypothetical protein [Syntrophales bacterium]
MRNIFAVAIACVLLNVAMVCSCDWPKPGQPAAVAVVTRSLPTPSNVLPVIAADVTVSNECASEGDTVVVTARLSNPAPESAPYKSVFYVDKQAVKSEDLLVEANSFRDIGLSIHENSACMRYVEYDKIHRLLVFCPISNPEGIDCTSFTDYFNMQPAIVYRTAETRTIILQSKPVTFTYYANHDISLKDNYAATVPTYVQLLTFLQSKSYTGDPYPAETMHNDAELAGIKCAFLWWEAQGAAHSMGWGPIGLPSAVSDAAYLVAFKTQDRGLVFVD